MPRYRRNSSKVGRQMPDADYIRFKVAEWLPRAVGDGAPVNDNFFECLEFALGGLGGIKRDLICLLDSTAKLPPSKTATTTINTVPSPKLTTRNSASVVEDLQRTHLKNLACELDNIWNEHEPLQELILELSLAYCQGLKKIAAPLNFQRSYERLEKIFLCDNEMFSLLEFVYILRNVSVVEHYFEDDIEVHKGINNRLLAAILDMPIDGIQKALDNAQNQALLELMRSDRFELPKAVEKLWHLEGEANIEELFYSKLKGEILPLAEFNLKAENVEHIKNLLTAPGETPVHILLYGAPGTGKTCFVNSLASALNFEAWEVVSREEDDDRNRRSSLVASAKLAARQKNTFILVDEAERLLDTNMGRFSQAKDKAWLNSFLEEPGQKIIWVTNSVRHLDLAVRRRFSFSQKFDQLTKAQRRKSWERIVTHEEAETFLTADEIKKLVKRFDVPVAVITKAVRQCKILPCAEGAFAKSIERILKAHLVLQADGRKLKKPPKTSKTVDKNYIIEAVTLRDDKENRMPVFMRNMHLLSERLEKPKSFLRGGGNVLFYGPPGTGKTELAHHIGQELGRKIIVIRASNLLSKWVGEAEKNIAAAFYEAEQKKAILVLDEVDSFLWPREESSHSWEVTQVNEFLTALENFWGISICTSNRRTNMDPAAMRRFHFKLAFDYARPDQVAVLYDNILAPLARGKTLTDLEKVRLTELRYLAPGDFAAVRSQFWLRAETRHQELIDALIKEQNLKLETKQIGF